MNLKREFELSTLLITHDIDEAVFLSDRVYILDGKPGKIIAEIKIDMNKNEDLEIQRVLYRKKILEIMNIKN